MVRIDSCILVLMENEDKQEIQYDDFAKLDIRIGRVVAAEMIPDADKLIKCTVNF